MVSTFGRSQNYDPVEWMANFRKLCTILYHSELYVYRYAYGHHITLFWACSLQYIVLYSLYVHAIIIESFMLVNNKVNVVLAVGVILISESVGYDTCMRSTLSHE